MNLQIDFWVRFLTYKFNLLTYNIKVFKFKLNWRLTTDNNAVLKTAYLCEAISSLTIQPSV